MGVICKKSHFLWWNGVQKKEFLIHSDWGEVRMDNK